MKVRLLISIIILVSCSWLAGQSYPGASSGNSAKTDSTETKGATFFQVFSGEPGKAALYSLVLPGAGQLYNKRWWKLPLVYGLEGTALALVIRNTKKYNQFDRCYQSHLAGIINADDCQGLNETDAFRIRNVYRSNKEKSYIFLIGAHLLQTLEAFIDRHLINFDTSEDLTIQQYPFESSTITLFTIGIPLNSTSKTPVTDIFGNVIE